jgi:hypothetical protein
VTSTKEAPLGPGPARGIGKDAMPLSGPESLSSTCSPVCATGPKRSVPTPARTG